MVTLELLAHTIGVPQAQLDELTPAVIEQRAQFQIASSLVTETGEPSGLPPNSHVTFALAAEATQDALLAQLALARRPRPPVTITALDRAQLVAALDPSPRFTALATRRVVTPASADPARGPLDQVRLAPSYPQPAIDALIGLAPELLLPGLEDVPADTVTLATTDQRFVEAFLLGMNHELDRELRWRGFPTVPGSTYFRRFWNTPSSNVDIVDLAQWAVTGELGEPRRRHHRRDRARGARRPRPPLPGHRRLGGSSRQRHTGLHERDRARPARRHGARCAVRRLPVAARSGRRLRLHPHPAADVATLRPGRRIAVRTPPP